MKVGKALACCTLAALAGGCSIGPPVPLAAVRVPSPVVVAPVPPPVVVAPAFYKPHPGRGLGHHKHGRWH